MPQPTTRSWHASAAPAARSLAEPLCLSYTRDRCDETTWAFRSRSDLAFFTFTMSSYYFAVLDSDNSASNLDPAPPAAVAAGAVARSRMAVTCE